MFDSIRELISYYNISFNDILITTDVGNIMALVFLDLISAFDFVDHWMLWSRLDHYMGIRGTVCNCFDLFCPTEYFQSALASIALL